jgi:hypothetical protein
MRGRVSIAAGIVVVAVAMSGWAAGPKISELGNKHNLSSLNTGVTYRASLNPSDPYRRDTQICIFCHTPHNATAQRPLWNRLDTTASFKLYSSRTLVIDNPATRGKSNYGTLNGSSRLCMSCHDGQTALGAVVSVPSAIATVGGGLPVFSRISSHHPVSFNYDANVIADIESLKGAGEYQYPIPGTYGVKLDHQGRVQCTSCHDPHQDKSTDGLIPFAVGGTHDQVCQECHKITIPAYPYPDTGMTR